MMQKDYWVRLLYTIIVSALIFVLVSWQINPTFFTALSLVKSIGLGAVIWLLAELLTEFAIRRWPHRIVPSYMAMFITIAVGTLLGTWLLGVESFLTMLVICVLAEICGFIISFIYHARYKKKLNTQLARFKENID